MQFRNAVLDDLPLIVSIYNSTIAGRMVTADTSPVTVEEKRSWFNEHNSSTRPLWMVEDEHNNITGWVSFQNFYGRPAYNGTAEISIYLDEKSRGKGLGKKILAHCFAQCKALHIDTLLGFIFAHNQKSIDLFINSGFEEWGNLKNIAQMDGQLYSLKIFGKRVT